MSKEIILTKEQSAKLDWINFKETFVVPPGTAFAYRMVKIEDPNFIPFMNSMAPIFGLAPINSLDDREFAESDSGIGISATPKDFPEVEPFAIITPEQAKEFGL